MKIGMNLLSLVGFLKNKIFSGYTIILWLIGLVLILGAYATYVVSTYIEEEDTSPQGYLLIDLNDDNKVVLSSDCPDGMVARFPDAIWYWVNIDGVVYPEGNLYLTPVQRLIRVRTEGWKPSVSCGAAYR